MTACSGAASVTDFARSITQPPCPKTFTAADVVAASRPGWARWRILRPSRRSNRMPVAAARSKDPVGTTRRGRRRRQPYSHRSHRPSQPGGVHGLGGRFPGPATRLVRLILSSVPGNVDLGTGIHGVQSLETRRAVAVNPRRGPRVSHTLARYPHVELWGGAVIP